MMRPGACRTNFSRVAKNAACGPPYPSGTPNRCALPTTTSAPASPGGDDDREREEIGADGDERAGRVRALGDRFQIDQRAVIAPDDRPLVVVVEAQHRRRRRAEEAAGLLRDELAHALGGDAAGDERRRPAQRGVLLREPVQLGGGLVVLGDVEAGAQQQMHPAALVGQRPGRPRDPPPAAGPRQPVALVAGREAVAPGVREHAGEPAGLLGRDEQAAHVSAHELLVREARRRPAGGVDPHDPAVMVQDADQARRGLEEGGGEVQSGERVDDP